MDEIARQINPLLRGWIEYYGRYSPSALYPLLSTIWGVVSSNLSGRAQWNRRLHVNFQFSARLAKSHSGAAAALRRATPAAKATAISARFTR